MTTALVLSVAIAAAITAVIASAIAVLFCSRSWRAVERMRSISSMQGELIEIRDYLSKVDAWMKRLYGRQVMQGRREDARSNETPSVTSSTGVTSKDELRRRVGIVAGRAAPHSEA